MEEVISQTNTVIKSLYVPLKQTASKSKFTFWCDVQTHTECVPEEPAKTHHFGLNATNEEKLILISL